MSRFNAYLRNAAHIIDIYDGNMPLAVYLKQYFAQHKKFGSKDRKQVAALCYQYFRLGYLFQNLLREEIILRADFICQPVASEMLKQVKPEWVPFAGLTYREKMEKAGGLWDATYHAQWTEFLQPETDKDAFGLSILKQPDLFIRIRPGNKEPVLKKLGEAGVAPIWQTGNCMALPNSTPVDKIISLNKDAVIQDASSQRCGTIITDTLPDLQGLVWDTCAASGGKTILLHDLYWGKLKWVITDIRESILHNLRQRLFEAGITDFKSYVADLSRPLPPVLEKLKVDAALVDAPCTGSGTWARTPEQHYFFDPNTLDAYSNRQLAICSRVIPCIKLNGYLIYITCSVFEKENGGVVAAIEKSFGMKLITKNIVHGMEKRADSMFVAILQKA